MFALSFIFPVFGRWSRNAFQLLLRRDSPVLIPQALHGAEVMVSFSFLLAVIAARSVGEMAAFLPGTMGMGMRMGMGRVAGRRGGVGARAACIP